MLNPAVPRVLHVLAGLGLLVFFASCHPGPTQKRDDRDISLGAEVYRVLCKRVAASAYPNDLSGERFNGPCEDPEKAPPDAQPKFQAMVDERADLVAGLDVALADEEFVPPEQLAATFAEGELDDLLLRLVPFYDPPEELLPNATRALARTLRGWLDPESAPGTAAIQSLSALSGRDGYRPVDRALGPVRTFLAYPRLDDVTLASLSLFDDDGVANEPFLRALTALGLELAEDETDEAASGDKTTLELALELLATPTDLSSTPDGQPVYVLKRDARGVAEPNPALVPMLADADMDGMPDAPHGKLVPKDGSTVLSPFPLFKSSDAGPRDEAGRALIGEEDPRPMFEHYDLNNSVLAALLRDTGDIVARDTPDVRSTLENLGRGLPVTLGPRTQRTETIGGRTLSFEGPDPAQAPILDLVHAIGTYLTLPETRPMLQVLQQLLQENESLAAQLVHAGLRIDEISDEYPNAFLTGADGTQNTPHDFWDHLIRMGRRMKKRDGMIEAVIRSFADPKAVPNGQIIANWMRYNNLVVYGDASTDDDRIANPDLDINKPATILADNKVVGAGNAVVTAYDRMLDPSMPGVGWNRSVWQRVLSMVHGLNGMKVCNKEGAYMKAHALIDLGLSPPEGEGPFEECAFVEVEDAVQQYNQAILGTAQIELKPSDATEWTEMWADIGSTLGISGTVGEEQEKDSGINGFTLEPTPESLHRFLFAPRNDFVASLFDPQPTVHGVSIDEWEPYGLFPMEIVDATAGMSFIEAAVPLVEAFENNELRNDDGSLVDGYMFGHMLSALHKHWAAPSDMPCTGPPEQFGCTQRQEPAAPFFSYQTNVRSYEPLISRALLDEGLLVALHENTRALAEITVDDGRDGIAVLAAFVEDMLEPREGVAYRDGRTVAYVNTHDPSNTNPDFAKPATHPDVPLDPDGTLPEGMTVEEAGDLPPIYLVLDALEAIDAAFEKQENQERHDPWLKARSDLVDLFLDTEEVPGATPEETTYRLKNRRAYAVTPVLLKFLIDRIDKHKELEDLETWGPGLADDVEDILAHPASAAGLDILDVLWQDATASRETADLMAYMFVDPDAATFAAYMEWVVHALQWLRNEDRTEAIARAFGMLLEPTTFEPGAAPNPAESATMWGLRAVVRVTRKFKEEPFQQGVPTPFNRLLRNLVHPVANDGRSPLEIFLDTIYHVHRADPSLGSAGFFTEADIRSLLAESAEFLDAEDHGLERLFQVVQSRKLPTETENGSPQP